MDIPPELIQPSYISNSNESHPETPEVQSLLDHLHLQPHPEGGYFIETDRNPLQVQSPLPSTTQDDTSSSPIGTLAVTRPASTTIYYLLTQGSPLGVFHRNLARTTHTWHRGRGRYVIIHTNLHEAVHDTRQGLESNLKANIETFVVGPDLECGERMQWVVDGGQYKTSFLLPDKPCHDQDERSETSAGYSKGLLISEVVVPGFDYTDHDFLRREQMESLLTREQVQALSWLLK